MRTHIFFILVGAATLVSGSPLGTPKEDQLKLSVSSHETGKDYHLNLVKPKSSVIHPNIQIVNVVTDEKTGELKYNRWTPTQEDLDAATSGVHVDPNHLAVVKVKHDNEGRQLFHGVVDGMTLEDQDGTPRLFQQETNFNSDYISIDNQLELESTLKYSVESDNTTSIVVEVAVVCDLDFGKLFNYDRRQFLEYYTVYFWDLTLRFQSLPSSNISFRVTSVTIVETRDGQPFIEAARFENGIIKKAAVLNPFANYMYDQLDVLPKFDIAMVVTNTPSDVGTAGVAISRSACYIYHPERKFLGVLIYAESGGFTSRHVAAHEIAHVLGAPHDYSLPWCEDRGFIMSGPSLGWFFSSCSDIMIANYVNSPGAACLRDDESEDLPVDPNLDTPKMTEQCQVNQPGSGAYVSEEDTALCQVTLCRYPQGGTFVLNPLQNSPCLGGGRCLHGRCLPPSYLLVNMGSGQCAKRSDGFTFDDEPKMVDCPTAPTQLDKFMVVNETVGIGKLLGVPFIIPAQSSVENADKCLWTSSSSDAIAFDRCEAEGADLIMLGWDFVDTGNNGEFLIKHRLTGKCIQQFGDKLKSILTCNPNDKASVWKFV